MPKNGAAHLASLQDDRCVFIDGKRVENVTTDPAFRGAVASACALYDYQAAPENIETMTFASPKTGARVNKSWMMPTSHAELVARRVSIERWSAQTCGMLGRSPDHVASTFVGFRMGLDVFGANDPKRAAALADYFDYIRDNDMFLSYVIVNPQADKAKSASGQPDKNLVASIVDEDAEGVTIRGAKMLATSGILANEIMVSGFQALQQGDEDYAFTVAMPLATRGLKLLSRRSYEGAATSTFDYPLSARFDENDAVVVFDDVKVPWERVFVYRDLKMAQAQWHQTRAHVMQNYQSMIRLTQKLHFLLGLARKIADLNNIITYPQVREQLGLIAAKVANMDALVIAMEAKGEQFGQYFVPDRSLLCTAQVVAQTTYPEIVEAIRLLSGGGMIMVPSSHLDFAADETADIIARTQRSPVAGSHDRVKLMKLAWDAVGSEFGSRHLQYEMFYSGAQFVTRGNSFRFFDWDNAKTRVDDFMASYDLDVENKLNVAAE
ncbi:MULTISPECIES: 4-hydroxyphenylacetate 3-hydroxylase family protein [Actibacterium]|uniref:4-hydroxyphenylacetate 3-monooxygenase n=1 Tax=Actibacterium naphthalenivorans TaxID=1614693 RepID=A0A840CD11_9RHOB|nr:MULTISPECIES: 4-hydroxyphenylacetate 3-hydroxylase N-terminal domain-containing protein [Actibacterium]ALG90716.1 4-hydroxyphenylacetate 3-monooxygenase [Actibacterium sp. EMB200-NS6]MBB4023080.1 4-hydroxyphenylacetate 3-monooxygenase [Actibacterium naphthalenivorans]